MNEELISILVVEDNPGDVRLLREALLEVKSMRYMLTHRATLTEAFASLNACSYEVVLLDLSLPDSQGLDALHQLSEMCPDIAIIVLTGNDDETVALNAMQAGAQDFLVKGQFEAQLLCRSIRYAIERNRLRRAVRALSLVDELTGLYNRRGFTTFAEQLRKVASRSTRGFLLIFADLDGMKIINDTYGHLQGDEALRSVARVFRATFREADVIARIGGDEFAVIAFESDEFFAAIARKRLNDIIDEVNSSGDNKFHLSLSVGVARYTPEVSCALDILIAQADAQMYEEKRIKNNTRTIIPATPDSLPI